MDKNCRKCVPPGQRVCGIFVGVLSLLLWFSAAWGGVCRLIGGGCFVGTENSQFQVLGMEYGAFEFKFYPSIEFWIPGAYV